MTDPNTPPPPDRRTRRTRKIVREALNTLMTKVRYDKITVQEIIEQADVGRSTFYAHWQDKEDLLVQSFEEVLHYFEEVPPATSNVWRLPVAGLFRHVQEQFHFYDSLEGGEGMAVIKKRMLGYFTHQVETMLAPHLDPALPSAVPLPILATYVSGTLLTLMEWWLARKMPYTPEEMEIMFERLVLPTIHSVLPPPLGER